VRFVHDLRNCLASMRAGASLLQNPGASPEIVGKVASALQSQIREMVSLVDQFVGKRSTHQSHSVPSHTSTGATASLNVLVADDNVDAANALALSLRLEGHRVTTAFGGTEALQLAAANPPDAMVLDIGMPTLDGYEVARTVRSQPWGANTRLIAVTGWMSQEDIERAKLAGFQAHLSKPIDMDLLQRLLQR
jgi:CheY-like chemotaxis protein